MPSPPLPPKAKHERISIEINGGVLEAPSAEHSEEIREKLRALGRPKRSGAASQPRQSLIRKISMRVERKREVRNTPVPARERWRRERSFSVDDFLTVARCSPTTEYSLERVALTVWPP